MSLEKTLSKFDALIQGKGSRTRVAIIVGVGIAAFAWAVGWLIWFQDFLLAAVLTAYPLHFLSRRKVEFTQNERVAYIIGAGLVWFFGVGTFLTLENRLYSGVAVLALLFIIFGRDQQ